MRAEESVLFRLAGVDDRSSIGSMLAAANLPKEGIAASGVVFVVAEIGGRVVGCVGIEAHGKVGLIRSLVVDSSRRGGGIARGLVERAHALAGLGGMRHLCLLTTDAAAFWQHFGYTSVARSSVPDRVRASAEFVALCPASAVCMTRPLGGSLVKVARGELIPHPDPHGASFWELALPRARLTWYEVPPDVVFPAHRHDGDQITFVLEGELVFHCEDGTERRLQAGEAVLVPAWAWHRTTAGPAGARAVDAWSHPLATHPELEQVPA